MAHYQDTLGKKEIQDCLKMVGRELLAAGQRRSSILLLGGAVMVLLVGNRPSTHDVDAVLESNAQQIRAAAARVAERTGLPVDWLNDGAKGFVYAQPPISLWQRYPGLDVYVPDLDFILSMKLVAGRPQDLDDSKAIVRLLRLQPADVFDILRRYVPSHLLTPRIQYVIAELFA